MYNDPHVNPEHRSGWIEVITGSMFSGKTEELIRRLKRALLARQKVVTFRSQVDTRSPQQRITTHDNQSMDSIEVQNAGEIISWAGEADVVGIDEGQFFDEKILEVCTKLANKGLRVIVAGLDTDYQGEPFGPMPKLMAIAEEVTKVHAICMRCGNQANYSHRLSKDESQVVIGAADKYEPLCRKCYIELTL